MSDKLEQFKFELEKKYLNLETCRKSWKRLFFLLFLNWQQREKHNIFFYINVCFFANYLKLAPRSGFKFMLAF